MRATMNTTYRLLQTALDRSNQTLQGLQLQAATGKKINKPSDEPASIQPILLARTQIKDEGRYLKNIQTGLNRTDTTDVSFDQMENILERAKEISVAATNGAMSPQDRATYADEVSQLRQSLLDTANAKFDGEYLFSGYLVTDASMGDQPAFVENPAYTAGSGLPPVLYNGDANSTQLEIAPSERVTVGVPGDQFLMPAGGQDLFGVLADLEESLRNDDTAGIQTAEENLATGTEQVRQQRSLLGNIGKRLEDAGQQTQSSKIDKQQLLSKFEDADMVEVVSNLQQQQQAFQAALAVTGKVSQLSILDYL